MLEKNKKDRMEISHFFTEENTQVFLGRRKKTKEYIKFYKGFL